MAKADALPFAIRQVFGSSSRPGGHYLEGWNFRFWLTVARCPPDSTTKNNTPSFLPMNFRKQSQASAFMGACQLRFKSR